MNMLADVSKVDRFEVIDETGRAYVKGSIYGSPVRVELDYQDDGKTLKVFVNEVDASERTPDPARASKNKPPLSSGELEELRKKLDAFLVVYGNDVLTTQPIMGPGYVETPVHIASRANVYTDKIVDLIQDYSNKRLEAVIGKLPEKRYHECGETLCDHAAPEYSYNQAIDEVTKLLKSEISHE